MKKVLLLSIVASAFVFAGGDIAPVEPAVVVPAPAPVPVVEAPSPISFYVGGGYSRIDADGSGIVENTGTEIALIPGSASYNIEADNYLLLAGVKINKYLAIEGRYTNSFDDFDYKYNNLSDSMVDGEVESYGIYAKPMYPVMEQVDVYGLLGYANTKISGSVGDLMDDNDFSWGAGASYKATDNLSVFVDYVRLYDDTVSGSLLDGDNVKVDSINVGMMYKF